VLKRIDKTTLAAPIIMPLALRIGAKIASNVEATLERDYKVTITIHPAVVEHMVKASYQAGGGTRPVEKAVTESISKAVRRGITDLDVARGGEVRLSVGPVTNNKVSLQVDANTGKSIELPLAQAPSTDPLQDREFVQKLKNLETVMNSEIYGQPEATEAIVKAVRAHQSTKLTNTRPLTVMLIGSTGTGKSETAKALALGLYGSKDRAVIIPFGNVQFEGDLNIIFNSPRGYQGSTQIGLFEQALINNPNGGVIALDELSNVSGNDPAMKEKLLKKYFYEIMDEGKFTSTVTNKTYDLGKYTFLVTGNDGEKLFFGMSSDDMRTSTWERNRDKEKVHKILRDNGVPEALIGRMADVILQRPATKASSRMIAKKLMREVLAPFEKIGATFSIDEAFTNALADKFYTHSKGGRSLRNVIENQVKAGVSDAVIEAGGWDDLKGKAISFTLQDNLIERTYSKPSDPTREVVISVFVEDKGTKTRVSTIRATEHATKFTRQSGRQAMATAYHEAGHAVVNDPKITGSKIAFITIRGQDGYLGYARYEELVEGINKNLDERTLLANIAKLLAGQMAQKKAGYGEDIGWSSDIKQARTMITRYLTEGGMSGMANIPVDKEGNVRLSGRRLTEFNAEFERLWKEGAEIADKTLAARWDLIRTVSADLLKNGEITSPRYTELERPYRGRPVLVGWKVSDTTGRLNRTPEHPQHPSNPAFGAVRSCLMLFKAAR
ncbi:MAG: AAA family ATPase, partial [Bdellovibrionota bacterium]